MIDLMLRACEPIGALAGAEDSKVAARSPRGGRRRSFHNPLSGCHRLQAVSHQDVVGESKPAKDGVDLGLAAHGEPGEAPLAVARVDALAHGATPVDRLAMGALHAPAPGCNTRAVRGAGRIGIGLVLAARRRAGDQDAYLGRPFGIAVLVKAAVDQMAPGTVAVALLPALKPRPHQSS